MLARSYRRRLWKEMYAEPAEVVGDRIPPAGGGVWAEARARAPEGIAGVPIAGT
jgi:hypothetical protein